MIADDPVLAIRTRLRALEPSMPRAETSASVAGATGIAMFVLTLSTLFQFAPAARAVATLAAGLFAFYVGRFVTRASTASPRRWWIAASLVVAFTISFFVELFGSRGALVITSDRLASDAEDALVSGLFLGGVIGAVVWSVVGMARRMGAPRAMTADESTLFGAGVWLIGVCPLPGLLAVQDSTRPVGVIAISLALASIAALFPAVTCHQRRLAWLDRVRAGTVTGWSLERREPDAGPSDVASFAIEQRASDGALYWTAASGDVYRGTEAKTLVALVPFDPVEARRCANEALWIAAVRGLVGLLVGILPAIAGVCVAMAIGG